MGGKKLPGDEVRLDLSALVLCSWLLIVFNAFLRSTSSLWCTRTMRASVKIHLAPLRDLIKKPELLWYDVLLFLFVKGPVIIYRLGRGGGKNLGLNKVKLSRSAL